jgi:hypothetical protein
LITKLEADADGLAARKLSAGLKLVGKTYHLPGSSLIPFSIKEADRKKWFLSDKRPSIIISGSKDDLIIDLPISEILKNYKKLLGPDRSVYFNFDSRFMYFDFPFSQNTLIAPIPPSRILLSGESDMALFHYLGWLSAFFSSELYYDPAIRLDTIHEASRIFGPWKTRNAISYARYLKTLDEFLDQVPNGSANSLSLLEKRLIKSQVRLEEGDLKSAIFGLIKVIRDYKSSKKPEFLIFD